MQDQARPYLRGHRHGRHGGRSRPSARSRASEMWRYRLLFTRRPRQVASQSSAVFARSEKQKEEEGEEKPDRVSSDRIKRRAERSLAWGPSDPQGPGLGYNNAGGSLLSPQLVSVSRSKKKEKRKSPQPQRNTFYITFTKALKTTIRPACPQAASECAFTRSRPAHPRPPRRQLVYFNNIKHPCGSGAK